MLAPLLFTEGTASVASTDVPFWCGIAEEAAPGDYLGNSAFTNVSEYLGSHSTKRGRQFDLDRIEAGTANILFRSLTAELDPSNIDSALYPNLKPLRRIRLFRHSDGVTYPMFDGLIERFNPEWRAPRKDSEGRVGYQDTHVQAVDAFEVLNNQQLLDPVYSTFTTSLTGSNNDILYTARAPGGSDISIEYMDPDPTNATGNFPLALTVSGKTITVQLSVGVSPAFLRTTEAQDVKDLIEADATANALVVLTYPGGGSGSNWLNNSGGASQAGTIAQTYLTGSGWAAEYTGARIERSLDAVAWATDARDIDSGIYTIRADEFSYDDNTSALAHIQDVADSELGYVFMDAQGNLVYHDGDHRLLNSRSTTSQATYSDDGVGWPFYDIQISFDKDRIVNDVTVTGGETTSIAQNLQDTSSQATFLRRAASKSTLLTSDDSALAIATSIVNAYAEPITRFESITLKDTGEVAGWADAVLAREIGDRVTVRTNPPGHSTTVSYDCFIEAIEHYREPGVPHTVVFQLTPISSAASGGGGGGGADGALLDSSGDSFVLDSGTAGVLG